jgi:hypothetical protein
MTNCVILKARKDYLPTKNRPEQVHSWLARKRDFGSPPDICSITRYGRSWLDWWSELQPSWRKPSSPGTLPPSIYSSSEGDLSSLKVSGKNGMLLVLVSFVWWGRGGAPSSQWTQLATDLRRCMERMSGMAIKRTREPSTEDSSSQKRYVLSFREGV